MRKPTSVNLTQEDIDFLNAQADAKGISRNDYLTEIISKLKRGETLSNEVFLGLDPLTQAKINQINASAKNAEASARLKNAQAVYWETFKQPPTKSAKQAIEQQITQQSTTSQTTQQTTQTILQNDGSMCCVSCGKLIPNREYGYQLAEDYQRHISYSHSRKLFESERKICLMLASAT